MLNKPKIVINAPIIMTFAAICLLALGLNTYTNGATTQQFFSVYRLDNMSITDFTMYIRYLGHVFGYSDLNRFLQDMFILLAIGPLIEEKYTSQKVMILILAITFITGIVHFIFFPGIQLMGPEGVLIGLLVMGSFTGDKDGSIPLSFLIMLIVLIGRQIYTGYTALGDSYTLAYVVQGVLGGIIGAGFTFK